LGPKPRVFGLEFEHEPNALDIEAVVDEFADAMETVHIVLAVAARAAVGAGGRDEAFALVEAEAREAEA
jgi:hypothetical protein